MAADKILIIAEAGVNHNGDLGLAKELARRAKDAGADMVKFQTFVPENMTSKLAQKADYQEASTGGGSQLQMLRKLALDWEDFRELSRFCAELNITFLSTPFDLESIRFLDTLEMPFWKVPSGEITNLPYLLAIAKTKKPVVLSTGMSEMEEIQGAVDALRANGTPEVTLLHCNTEYPTPYRDVNLQAMAAMGQRFCCPVGYSDHTLGIEVPIAAAALGAAVIEKHFTLDRAMEGPDHRASLEPQDLKAMVRAIRHIEKAMGDGVKRASPSERKNITIARKSIVARRAIRKGETLTEENLTVKRPGHGVSPMRWFEVLGTTAVRDFGEDELIEIAEA